MIVAVIGSRNAPESARRELNRLLAWLAPHIGGVVSGGAVGPDTWAANFANTHRLPLTVHLPDWRQGRGAPIARNRKIIQDGDFVIAVHIGDSRGTAHALRCAELQGKPAAIFNGTGWQTTGGTHEP